VFVGEHVGVGAFRGGLVQVVFPQRGPGGDSFGDIGEVLRGKRPRGISNGSSSHMPGGLPHFSPANALHASQQD
jgi:hypothetical protein